MGCCQDCCCCRKAANQVDDQSDLNDEASARPPHKCRCLRKFLAITCSQLGLLIFLVIYLIGGSYLFTYLEREHQQTRLNQGIMEVQTTYEDLTESMRRVKRSLDGEISPRAKQMGLHCVDFQIETLQAEIQRLERRLSHEHLKTRAAELGELQQKMSAFKSLEKTEQLETILNQIVNINLTSQIRSYEKFLKRRRTSGAVSDISSEKLNNLIRHVHDAVKAGWTPPSLTTDEGQHSISTFSINPRARPPPSTTPPSILDSRLPRSDPWTLSGSLFYVITVITTIGYGEVVPVTKYGRLATILYGLFGIPMMLLFLANLGSLMADVFRILYKRLCCCFIKHRKPSSSIPTPSTSNQRSPNINSPRKVPVKSLPLTIRSTPGRSTLGGPPGGKSSVLQELVKKTSPFPGITDSLFITLAGRNSVFAKALLARKESRSVRIPIWLILVIFAFYLIIGAIIFAYWEKWTFLDAMYFVFVTISTIGFGDMLPGLNDPHSTHRLYKFIASNVYLVLGLAIVVMCFDLMQSEVKRRSKKLARRIGLISSLS
ncbi:hypothetical protein Aperf_G00000025284 [Anoplocephala perfoliata]